MRNDQGRACLPWLPFACFSKWTRSGGPSSRKEIRESVRVSMDSWIISSVSLQKAVSQYRKKNVLSWRVARYVLGNRRRDHDDGWRSPTAT